MNFWTFVDRNIIPVCVICIATLMFGTMLVALLYTN